MKLSPSLLILTATTSLRDGVDGFITQHRHPAYTHARLEPLFVIDPTAIDQLAQIDPSAIQSQVTNVLPNFSQIDISTILASNAALVNGGIGVGSFLLGAVVSGKDDKEAIEGLEKSVADQESLMQELRTKLEEAQKVRLCLHVYTYMGVDARYLDHIIDHHSRRCRLLVSGITSIPSCPHFF